jgi:hypothetical protein
VKSEGCTHWVDEPNHSIGNISCKGAREIQRKPCTQQSQMEEVSARKKVEYAVPQQHVYYRVAIPLADLPQFEYVPYAYPQCEYDEQTFE